MDDVNEWNELEQKLDIALEHNTSELHQIAEIYKRLGMTEQATEIERTIARQEKIVPITSGRTTRQSRQIESDSQITTFRTHAFKRANSQ